MSGEIPSGNIEKPVPKQPQAEKLAAPEAEKSDLDKAKEHFDKVKSELGTFLKDLDVNKKGYKKEYKDKCKLMAEKMTAEEMKLLQTESNAQGDKHNDYRALNHITKVDEKVSQDPEKPPIRFYFRIDETPAPAHFEGVVKKGDKIQME